MRHYHAKHRDKERAYQRQYCRDNRDAARERSRIWREKHPEMRAAAHARRRALKANAPQGDPQEAAAFAEILREGICELCGSHGPIEVDHIEALSTGGEHGSENFAGLCKSCNVSKHDKSLLTHLL